MPRAFALGFLALALAAPARAEIGVGAAVQGRPGVSVQYAPARDEAYHVLAQFGNDAALAQLDYQRFFRPRSLKVDDVRGGVYAGIGMIGQAERGDAAGERWYLHLPVGVQADVTPLHLSVFAELAGRVGALPGTGLSTLASGGVRATF
jgi:hypothetical protein